MADEITLTIEGPDGSDELTIPESLVELVSDPDDDSAAEVIGDVSMLGLAGRIHNAVHHAEEEVDQEVEAAEEATMDCFERRFGASYTEVTGHHHH